MIYLLIFVIFGLATWRLSSLLVNEAGPFNVFVDLREMIGITHDDEGNPIMYPKGFLPELFKCVWCMSVWVGIFATLLLPFFALIAIPLALSAVAIIVDAFVNNKGYN